VGLTLDESKEGDRHQELDGMDFVISERDASMVLLDGPVSVQFSDRGWWSGYRVTAGRGGGTCS
jgi:hypothetical protein